MKNVVLNNILFGSFEYADPDSVKKSSISERLASKLKFLVLLLRNYQNKYFNVCNVILVFLRIKTGFLTICKGKKYVHNIWFMSIRFYIYISRCPDIFSLPLFVGSGRSLATCINRTLFASRLARDRERSRYSLPIIQYRDGNSF